MSEEKVVEIIWNGRPAKVYVGKFTFGDVADINDNVIEVSANGKVKILPGKLKLWLVYKGVKKIEVDGKTVKWTLKDVENLDVDESMKILEVVTELNNVDELFR